jgi:ABC-type sugar transport system, permease component
VSVLQDVELKGKGKKTYRLILIALVFGVPFQVFPFVWMLSNSFKTSLEIIKLPPSFIPEHFLWKNVVEVFKEFNLWGNIVNTFLLCFGTIFIQVTISALASYSLSKLKTRASKYILLFFVGTLMINNEAILFQTYIMMYDFPIIHIKLINSFWSVLLALSASGWSIFIFKGFFDGLPNELIESAKIDGANSLSVFAKIVLPLSKPVFSVVVLTTFMGVYNQLLFPLVLLPDSKKWTIMIRIYAAASNYTAWNKIMVLLSISTIPLLLVYIFCQKYIVQGITMTGLKS